MNEMRDRNAFLNGDSDLGYASFEYEFQFASGTVRYEYRKAAPDSIVYERLTLNGKDVFIRDGNASDYSGLRNLDAGDLRMDVPDGSLAVLRYVANNTVQCPDSPMSLVMGFAERMHFFGSLLDDPGVMQDDGSESPEDYIVRNGLVNDFQSFLNDMAGMDVELATEDRERTDSIPLGVLRRHEVPDVTVLPYEAVRRCSTHLHGRLRRVLPLRALGERPETDGLRDIHPDYPDHAQHIPAEEQDTTAGLLPEDG